MDTPLEVIVVGLGVAGETLNYAVYQKRWSTYLCHRGKESDVYMVSATGVVFSKSVVRVRMFIHSFRLHTFRAFSWHKHNDCRLGLGTGGGRLLAVREEPNSKIIDFSRTVYRTQYLCLWYLFEIYKFRTYLKRSDKRGK